MKEAEGEIVTIYPTVHVEKVNHEVIETKALSLLVYQTSEDAVENRFAIFG